MGTRDDERRERILAERAKAAAPAAPPAVAPTPVEAAAPQPLRPRVAAPPPPPAPSLTEQWSTWSASKAPVKAEKPAPPPEPEAVKQIKAWSEAHASPLPLPPKAEAPRVGDNRALVEPGAVAWESALSGKFVPVSPEVKVREAARDADTRARAQKLLQSRGMKAILGLDDNADAKEIRKSLSETDPDRLRLDHQRFLEQQYDEVVGPGKQIRDLPPEQQEATRAAIAKRAALDVATLRTVGMFTHGQLGMAERDPKSLADAAKPQAEVVGLDKGGQPVVRYEGPGAYLGDLATMPAYVTVSTGLPQKVFQGTFGASPDAKEFEKGRVFDPSAIRERRTFLDEAFETNPYDKGGLVNKAVHALPKAVGANVDEATADEAAATVNTILAPVAGATLDVVHPDPLSLALGGVTAAGYGIKALDKTIALSKLERAIKVTDKVANTSEDATRALSDAIKAGAEPTEVERALVEARDAFTKETSGLHQQAKDAIEDAARVRTRVEEAALKLDTPMPYSTTALAGSLEDATKAERLIVSLPHATGATMNVAESVNRVLRAMERGLVTPAEAAAYGERLFDTTAVTARALVDGVKKEQQVARSAASALLSALEKGSVKGRDAMDAAATRAEKAKAAFAGKPEKAKAAMAKATEKAYDALHTSIAEGGLPVSPREIEAFRGTMIKELASRLPMSTPQESIKRAAQMVDGALATTAKGDGRVHPETMAALDALFRAHSTEIATGARTVNPLRTTGAAQSLLLGEGGLRNRALLRQGNPTATQVAKRWTRTAWEKAIKPLFMGDNEIAPWTKEGLTDAARTWAHDAERMVEAVHADMDGIHSAEDAGLYLDGGQTRTNGLLTSGKNRTSIFLENVELRPGKDGNVLDFVKAMLAPPIGRPEMLDDRGWYRAQMAVIDAVRRCRDAEASGQQTVEAIRAALNHFTVPHANLDGWTRRTTAWIATQAEDVALLDRGFGDGIVLTEREHDNLEALAGGAFTLAGGERPAGAVERALATRRFAGAGAEWTPVRIGSVAGAMDAEGAHFLEAMQAQVAAKTDDPLTRLHMERAELLAESQRHAKEYKEDAAAWNDMVRRATEARDDELLASLAHARPVDRSSWYADKAKEWAGKIRRAEKGGGEVLHSRVASSATETPAFKRWFGDPKNPSILHSEGNGPYKVGYRAATVGESVDAVEATFATREEAEAAIREGAPLEGFEVWSDAWAPTPGRAKSVVSQAAKAAAESGDEALAAVANHLVDSHADTLNGVVVRTNERLPARAVGRYDPTAKVIDLGAAATPKTAVHEAIHAVTHEAISRPYLHSPAVQTAVRNLTDLHKLVRSIPGIEDTGRIYGLTSVDEFVAEAMSSPDFQDILREIRVTVKDGRYVLGAAGEGSRSLWDSFVEAMSRILGFSDTDALGHVLANTQTIIREGGADGGVVRAADSSARAKTVREAAEAVKAKAPGVDFDWMVRHPSPSVRAEVEAFKDALRKAGMDDRPGAVRVEGVNDAQPMYAEGRRFLAPAPTKPPSNPKLQQATRLYTQTMDSTVYVPKMVREKMTTAIARSYTPDTGIARSMLSWWKLSVTRGALTARPGYLLNNVTGDFEQVMLAFGLQDAVKTSVRAEGASLVAIAALGTPTAVNRLVVEPVTGALTAAAIDDAWGIIVSSFAGENKNLIAKALHASADVGERAGQIVSKMLGRSAFRIEVGKILEGGPEAVRVGDHYYSAAELKEAAVRYGVWDNFDKAELAPEMASLGKLFQLPATGVQHIAETVSLRRRLGLYVTLLENGMKPEEAARGVTKALFDYRATLSDSEKKYISTFLLPFWSWQKNMNRLLLGSVASPLGAYRVKLALGMGRAAEDIGHNQAWFTGRPAADGDDVGLLTTYMIGQKAQDDYQAFRTFREAVEAKEGRISPREWNTLIWKSNPEIPASLEWATRADVEPKLTEDQIVNLRGYLAPWWTPEMAKSYLRDRAGVRMRHLSTGPQLGEGEGDAFWNVYAPRSGVDGALEWTGRGLAALYSACTFDGPAARENLGAMADVGRAPVISDLLAMTQPDSPSTRRVAQGLAAPLYKGSRFLATPIGSFLSGTGTVDAIADHPLARAITVKDGVYTIHPMYSWIADAPFIADLNKRLMSEESMSGKGKYSPDALRTLLNAYGFQTPTVTNEDVLREVYDREAEAKQSISQLSRFPTTEGASTSAE